MAIPPRGDHAHTSRRTLETLLGSPALEGNKIDVLRNGDEIFPAILDCIARAERSVDLLTFIYWQGEIGHRFSETLAARAEHGVRVRVLLDAVGCRKMSEDSLQRMRTAGVDVQWFRPVDSGKLGEVNHRTHRKVIVCDETIGFTGGVGIADQWMGDARDETEWRDTHFRIEGPAVDGLRAAFIDNWAETGGGLFDPGVDAFPEQPRTGSTPIQVVRGAAETGWSNVATMFRSMTQLARERIRITSAYFSPDETLLDMICDAAHRGVNVEILVPGPHIDKRFVRSASERTYSQLLDAGATVWEYQRSMLHAKVMTVDGFMATVGSANVNNRSNEFDEEVNLIVYDANLVEVLDRHFDDDVSQSTRIEPDRWDSRGLLQRVKEGAAATVDGLV